MDLNNNNETTENQKPSNEISDATVNTNTPEATPAKKVKRQATPEQLSNPFHGVKLVQILEELVAYYGWQYLAERVKIRCFMYNPTMKSSLGFLRKTRWAREHVEDLYLDMLDEKKAKEKS